ncbi:MAG: DUF1836 domain-containing protein [Bilifractor sp.]
MSMTREAQIKESLQRFQLPSYTEIPNVGLYLKQVVKYINDFLEPLQDDPLTVSMVSNYVKHKLIPNPIRKMYYREHIAYLFFIAVTKCVLSLEEIRFLLTLQEKTYDTDYTYNRFKTQLEDALHHLGSAEDRIPAASTGDSEGHILLRNTIITISHKIYMDKYFYYTQLAENETEKQNPASAEDTTSKKAVQEK